MTDVLVTTPADREVATVILAAAHSSTRASVRRCGGRRHFPTSLTSATLLLIRSTSSSRRTSMRTRGDAGSRLGRCRTSSPRACFHPSLTGVLTSALANNTSSPTAARLAGSRRVQAGAREGDGRQPPRRPNLSDDPTKADPRSEHEPTGQQLQDAGAQSGLPAILRASGIHAGRWPRADHRFRSGIEFPRPGSSGRRSSRPRAIRGQRATHHRRPPDGNVPEIQPVWSCRVTGRRRDVLPRCGKVSRCASQRRTLQTDLRQHRSGYEEPARQWGIRAKGPKPPLQRRVPETRTGTSDTAVPTDSTRRVHLCGKSSGQAAASATASLRPQSRSNQEARSTRFFSKQRNAPAEGSCQCLL